MSQSGKTIFADRRASKERRQQALSMPEELDRRQGLRRDKGFESKPWWLQVSYANELVSAKDLAQAVGEIRQQPSKLGDRNKKTND